MNSQLSSLNAALRSNELSGQPHPPDTPGRLVKRGRLKEAASYYFGPPLTPFRLLQSGVAASFLEEEMHASEVHAQRR
jgi:hypothetical protein